jgi:hypothetical protein
MVSAVTLAADRDAALSPSSHRRRSPITAGGSSLRICPRQAIGRFVTPPLGLHSRAIEVDGLQPALQQRTDEAGHNVADEQDDQCDDDVADQLNGHGDSDPDAVGDVVPDVADRDDRHGCPS